MNQLLNPQEFLLRIRRKPANNDILHSYNQRIEVGTDDESSYIRAVTGFNSNQTFDGMVEEMMSYNQGYKRVKVSHQALNQIAFNTQRAMKDSIAVQVDISTIIVAEPEAIQLIERSDGRQALIAVMLDAVVVISSQSGV